MKRLGLIGGTSWESTIIYYRELNLGVRQRLGGLHSAPLILNSVDFAEFVPLLEAHDWEELARALLLEALHLERIGAQALVLCTNTMHIVADQISAAVDVPLLDILAAVLRRLKKLNFHKPLLLGTCFTMEQGFYNDYFARQGVELLVPDADDRLALNDIVFKELVKGQVLPSSRQQAVRLIEHARQRGADSVIFGCTELAMLVEASASPLPIIDSLRAHVDAALDFAFS